MTENNSGIEVKFVSNEQPSLKGKSEKKRNGTCD